MAIQVGIEEFKRDAPRLIERASRGERIVITRRGKPHAQLQPADQGPVLTPRNRACAREQAAFEALLPRLRRKYEGCYVAVQGGVVVDSDQDEDVLFARVWASDQETPFFIGAVGIEEPVIDMPGFEIIR